MNSCFPVVQISCFRSYFIHKAGFTSTFDFWLLVKSVASRKEVVIRYQYTNVR